MALDLEGMVEQSGRFQDSCVGIAGSRRDTVRARLCLHPRIINVEPLGCIYIGGAGVSLIIDGM